MYVTVLCVSEDRTITVAWPPAEERNTNIVEPGVPKSIPMVVWANPDWPLERPMRDRYIVIATEAWADFSIFVNKESQLVTKPKFDSSRGGTTEAMPGILEQAFLGRSTRGGRSLKPKRAGFSVVALDAHMVAEN